MKESFKNTDIYRRNVDGISRRNSGVTTGAIPESTNDGMDDELQKKFGGQLLNKFQN